MCVQRATAAAGQSTGRLKELFVSGCKRSCSRCVHRPEEGAEAPLQGVQHLQLQLRGGILWGLPIVDVGQHGGQQALVGHELHILGCNVDAGQVHCRQPAHALRQ